MSEANVKTNRMGSTKCRNVESTNKKLIWCTTTQMSIFLLFVSTGILFEGGVLFESGVLFEGGILFEGGFSSWVFLKL